MRQITLLLVTLLYIVTPAVAFAFRAPLLENASTKSVHPSMPFFDPNKRSQQRHHSAPVLWMGSDDTDNDGSASIVQVAGLVASPIVWVSLYFVKTTGGGLPAGPFGLIGALEGISYLVVVGLTGAFLFKTISKTEQPTSAGEGVALATILAGLLVLASLVVDQGCVPNAKPILDYSSYLPVCNPEETPGFFGGS